MIGTEEFPHEYLNGVQSPKSLGIPPTVNSLQSRGCSSGVQSPIDKWAFHLDDIRFRFRTDGNVIHLCI